MLRSGLLVALSILTLSFTSSVSAGGYDTPILYSARHLGMGGTAIGYVRDPSALFHNPAGLGHTRRAAVLGDFSLLIGNIHSSPELAARDQDADPTIAPFFLLGGAVRATDWLTFGLGVYPVASAGATYNYTNSFSGVAVENTTKLLFLEFAAAAAVNLPHDINIGLAYRVTYVSLDRFQGGEGQPPFLDFSLSGLNFLGFRAGIQWAPSDAVDLGFTYRHRTDTVVDANTGIAANLQFTDPESKFTLPSRFGLGGRFVLPLAETAPRVALATDIEYALNSQNGARPLSGVAPGDTERTFVPNVFNWQNSWTVRLGAEVGLLRDETTTDPRLNLRTGFVWDGKTANEQYPTAFGTPPGPTYVATLGAGWDGGPWEVNLAYAFRAGSGDVTNDDLNDPERETCSFCSVAGNDPYSIQMHGLYVDLSYDIE